MSSQRFLYRGTHLDSGLFRLCRNYVKLIWLCEVLHVKAQWRFDIDNMIRDSQRTHANGTFLLVIRELRHIQTANPSNKIVFDYEHTYCTQPRLLQYKQLGISNLFED